MQFFAFEKLAHSVHPVRSERANGARFTCAAKRSGAASGASAGWAGRMPTTINAHSEVTIVSYVAYSF
jgi:hypothetical protein